MSRVVRSIEEIEYAKSLMLLLNVEGRPRNDGAVALLGFIEWLLGEDDSGRGPSFQTFLDDFTRLAVEKAGRQ